MTSWKSFVGSFSQTLFFGGVTQKPEIRLCSQAIPAVNIVLTGCNRHKVTCSHVVLETSVTQSKRHCHEDWFLYLFWCVHFTFVYLEHYSNVAKQMLSNVLTVSHHSIINRLNKNMLSSESSVACQVCSV